MNEKTSFENFVEFWETVFSKSYRFMTITSDRVSSADVNEDGCEPDEDDWIRFNKLKDDLIAEHGRTERGEPFTWSIFLQSAERDDVESINKSPSIKRGFIYIFP